MLTASVFALYVALLLGLPVAFLYGMNVVFGFAIPFTPWTYAGAAIVVFLTWVRATAVVRLRRV